MKDDPWYNGYPLSERIAKFKELVRLRDCGELGRIKGPCALCGDPDPPFDPPFEDHRVKVRSEAITRDDKR
jgi:hypothetical protein